MYILHAVQLYVVNVVLYTHYKLCCTATGAVRGSVVTQQQAQCMGPWTHSSRHCAWVATQQLKKKCHSVT